MSIELFRFLWNNVQVLRVRILQKSIMRGGNEGPNWILFAGGAAVTALSYIIGRRQKHGFDDSMDVRDGKSGKAHLANHRGGFDSGYTSKACSRQDSFGSVNSCYLDNSTRLGLPTGLALVNGTKTGGLDDGFHANNHQDRQESLPSAEVSGEERSYQSSVPSTQEEVRRSNPHGVQTGRTAKRDMVHRLRKQLKSRDQMILSMQIQISEHETNLSLADAHVSELQARLEASESSLSLSDANVSGFEARLEASERCLSMSDAHSFELQARLEAYGGVLSDVDKELQLLRNQLADLSCKDAKEGDCSQAEAGNAELVTSCGDEGRDMHATLLEVKKLRELLDRLEALCTAREIGWEALSKEHQAMLDKVDHLECALNEQRALVSEKQQALDMNQVELLGVTSKLQESQHLLQAQIEETESLRRSQAELEVYVNSLIKAQDTDEREAKLVKADNSIETRDVDNLESDAPKSNGFITTEDVEELESDAPKSNGFVKTEDVEELGSTANGFIKAKDIDDPKAKIPSADRLFESQDIGYDLVKTFDSVSESGSEARDSIDSDFDEMLDGTLDDMVKVFSTSVTPASTPKSSVLSPGSGSKKFQYF